MRTSGVSTGPGEKRTPLNWQLCVLDGGRNGSGVTSEECMRDSKTILVVDDGDEIRRLVCGMLSKQGYNCLSASNGADALNLIERGEDTPHLMLTDMVMPQMMGAELAVRAARLRPDLRIVLMSGFSDDPVVRLYQGTPAAFIAKPFTASALCAKIREALDRPWDGLPDPAARDKA